MLIPQEPFFEGLGFENLPNLSCDGCHKGPDGRFYHIDHFDKVYVIECAHRKLKHKQTASEMLTIFPMNGEKKK